MNITELTGSTVKFFREVLKQECRVITIVPKENGWTVICEVTVDPEYTSVRGIGDVVERYEVQIDSSMRITAFSLKETKRKAALDNE